MKHFLGYSSIIVCLALLIPAIITGNQTDGPDASAVRPPLVSLSEAEAEKLPPLQRELRGVLLKEKADLQVLASRLAALDDRLAALEVQREISNRKFQTQIEFLEIQGRFAREEGRIELAEEAEHALSRLKTRQNKRPTDQGGE
jgi:hypothetical protein